MNIITSENFDQCKTTGCKHSLDLAPDDTWRHAIYNNKKLMKRRFWEIWLPKEFYTFDSISISIKCPYCPCDKPTPFNSSEASI